MQNQILRDAEDSVPYKITPNIIRKFLSERHIKKPLSDYVML
jgi:hypothetical protein